MENTDVVQTTWGQGTLGGSTSGCQSPGMHGFIKDD